MAKKFWSLLGLFAAFLVVLTNLQVIVPVAVISCTATVVWHFIHAAFQRDAAQNMQPDFQNAGQQTISLPKPITPQVQREQNFEALEMQLTNYLKRRDPFCDWQWRDFALRDYQRGSRFLAFRAVIHEAPYEGCLHVTEQGLWNTLELRRTQAKSIIKKEVQTQHEGQTEKSKETLSGHTPERNDTTFLRNEETAQNKPKVQIVGEKEANDAFEASLQNSADQWLEEHRDEIIILDSQLAQEGGAYTYHEEALPEKEAWAMIAQRFTALGLLAQVQDDGIEIRRAEREME